MLEFQFESVLAFFAMAPHGPFVWSTYLLGVVTLVGLTLMVKLGHRQALKRIRRQIEREASNESKA